MGNWGRITDGGLSATEQQVKEVKGDGCRGGEVEDVGAALGRTTTTT